MRLFYDIRFAIKISGFKNFSKPSHHFVSCVCSITYVRSNQKDDLDNTNLAYPSMVSTKVANANGQANSPSQGSFRQETSICNGCFLPEGPLRRRIGLAISSCFDNKQLNDVKAWKVSRKPFLCQEFQKLIQNFSQELDECHLRQIMNQLGESGLVGVLQNIRMGCSKSFRFHENKLVWHLKNFWRRNIFEIDYANCTGHGGITVIHHHSGIYH